jgi:hypothetical protein
MANTNVVPQGIFGPGVLYVTRTDVANSTPFNVGFCHEFSTDLSFDVKDLYGQKQFPLLSARGTAKATGKIIAATMSGQALNTMMLGGTWTAGTQYDTTISASTAIPTTPFTITPTVPSSGTWDGDLGVTVSVAGTSGFAVGQPLTKVANSPTTGQYSVSAGVYLFAAADDSGGFGISVQIAFSYHYASAPGQSQTWANTDIGTTPTFQLDYKSTLYGATYYLRIFQAICTKWSMGHKLTDFAPPEFDFSFFANAGQNIGLISLASQA